MEGLDIFQKIQETTLTYVTLKDITDHAVSSIFTEVTFPPILYIMDKMSGQISGRDYKTDAGEAIFVEVDYDINVD